MHFLNLDPLIRLALQEDIGRGDLTTNSIVEASGERSMLGRVVAKEPLVLAGWSVFVRVFELLGEVQSRCFFAEGDSCQEGRLGEIEGPASILLQGERVALNLLQRSCGIATQTRQWVELAGPARVRLLDTRKTTPLWRALDKYAVRQGGGSNHRMGLDDAVLIKENHIQLAGGLKLAVEACRRRVSHLTKIEVEVQNFEELREALELSVDVIMLDNMSPTEVADAVRMTAGKCLLEASGGIRQENLPDYAATGVDFISVGALTHSFRSSDISMLLGATPRNA